MRPVDAEAETPRYAIVYTCVYVRIHTHTHTHIHIYIYAYIYIYIYNMYICIYIHINNIYVCIIYKRHVFKPFMKYSFFLNLRCDYFEKENKIYL